MSDHARLPIEGMTCTSCASRITRAVRKLDGVESVRVDLGSDWAEVIFDPVRTTLGAIAAAVRQAGYEPRVDHAEPFTPAQPRRLRMTTRTRSSSQSAVSLEALRPSLGTAIAALPTRLKVAAGLAAALAILLAAGVPFSTFVPFAGLAGCVGMHFFMGHGHRDHHSDERSPDPRVR